MFMEQIQKVNDFINKADVLEWYLSGIEYLLSKILL